MLGKNLQTLLKKKGITLAELARKTGISKSTLSGITAGAGDSIKLSHLKKLSSALDVSVHELAYGTPDPKAAIGEEILTELFRGDCRVVISKIGRRGK